MMTSLHDISLGLTTVFLLTALIWSVCLRRKVKEQTKQIRLQILREAALEKQCSELFENANDLIYTLDLDGNVTSVNKAGERIMGYVRSKAIGMAFKDFVAPGQHPIFDQWMQKCKAGTAPPECELEIVTGTGRRSIIEASSRLIREEGKSARIEGIARDITERKRAEEALRQSEERFSSAFRLSPISIAISTVEEGRFIDVNDSFLRMFDFSREMVINRTAGELGIWVDAEDLAKINKMLQERQSVCGMECKFRTRSGATRIALVFVERIGLGSAPCTLFITHDISDRLTLENQLRQAQKMEAVGRLAAGVAHDFNNLLTVIQGHSEIVMNRKELPGDLLKSLETVCDASQRAANLTRQLLTFSRQQNMQPKSLDLNVLINDEIKMLKHLLNDEIIMKYSYAANLPLLRADPTMVEQIIMNLAVNARDAMQRGGTLTIATQATEITEAYVAHRAEARPGNYVCLTVSDTGCGMDQTTQARIFEPFFTTKEAGKGTGLGLATVYGIVKQHLGWVELTSEVGKGTTFKIFFPSEKPVRQTDTKSNARKNAQTRKTILVVEDEQSVAEVVYKILTSQGFRVLRAASAIEALQLWNEQAGQIDLLLTDMVMPKGMSGRELAQNLQALKPELKIVYTTGYSREIGGLGLELQEGLNFLAKPHAPPKLIEIVRSRLDSEQTTLVA